MSDKVSLVAERRSLTGKKVKQLRRDGWIPAVIYGQQEPVSIQLENGPLRRVLRAAGTSDLLEIEMGSDHRTVLVRDIQQHATRGDLIHVDFLEVDMKQVVTATADLVLVNVSGPQTRNEGTPVQELRSIDFESLPDDLISEIEVDLSMIDKISDQIIVEQLPIPEGVTLLTDPDALVVRIQPIQEIEEEEEEEEDLYVPSADSVEVIEKGKQEEDDF